MQVLVDEPLVVAEVEVGLPAVLGDEHLAVLERVHGARVDVDVRVELAHGDLQAPALEEPTERGGGEPLAERRGHPAGEEDVLGLSLGHVGAIRIGHGPRLPDTAAPGCGPRTVTGSPPAVGAPRRRAAPRAWRRAASLSGLPDSIRLISTTRPSASSTVTSDRVRPSDSTLRTSIWCVGLGGHLGQVGDHQHLGVVAQPGQGRHPPRWRRPRPPRRPPRRRPARPGRRSAPGARPAWCGTARPPKPPWPGAGRARPDWRRARRSTSSALPSPSTAMANRAEGMARSCRVASISEASSGAARRRSRATTASASATAAGGPRRSRRPGPGPCPRADARAASRPAPRRRRPAPRPGSAPYLRRSSWSSWRRARTSSSRAGSSSHVSTTVRSSPARSAELGHEPTGPARSSASRGARPASAPDASASRSTAPAPRAPVGAGQGHQGRRRPPPGGRTPRPAGPPRPPARSSSSVPVGAGRGRSRRPGRPAARPRGPAGGRRRRGPRPRGPGRPGGPGPPPGARCRRPEGVERPPLGLGDDQGPVLVLAVQLDQSGGGLGQGADRGHAARRSTPGTGPRAATDRARTHLVPPSTSANRPSTRASSAPVRTTDGSARPPSRRLRAPTRRVLPAPGLPGQRGHARPEGDGHVVDDPEVADVELDQEAGHAVPYRSARWNFARRMAWKSREPKVTRRAGRSPSRQSTVEPGLERAAR